MFNVFMTIFFTPWSEEEIQAYLAERLAGSEVEFSEKTIRYIVEESGGLPGEVIRLASEKFDRFRK